MMASGAELVGAETCWTTSGVAKGTEVCQRGRPGGKNVWGQPCRGSMWGQPFGLRCGLESKRVPVLSAGRQRLIGSNVYTGWQMQCGYPRCHIQDLSISQELTCMSLWRVQLPCSGISAGIL